MCELCFEKRFHIQMKYLRTLYYFVRVKILILIKYILEYLDKFDEFQRFMRKNDD